MATPIKHVFKFSAKQYEPWTNLLSKYYPSVSVKATVDNKQIFFGDMHTDFFGVLPLGSEYKVETENICSQTASIKALPEYTPMEMISFCQDDMLGLVIDDVIQSRLKFGDRQIGVTGTYQADNLGQILKSKLCFQRKEITRFYVSPNGHNIILVLKERYPIQLTTRSASDIILPIFDIQNGFIGTGSMVEELNLYFHQWLRKFKVTNGESWDEPIVVQH